MKKTVFLTAATLSMVMLSCSSTSRTSDQTAASAPTGGSKAQTPKEPARAPEGAAKAPAITPAASAQTSPGAEDPAVALRRCVLVARVLLLYYEDHQSFPSSLADADLASYVVHLDRSFPTWQQAVDGLVLVPAPGHRLRPDVKVDKVLLLYRKPGQNDTNVAVAFLDSHFVMILKEEFARLLESSQKALR